MDEQNYISSSEDSSSSSEEPKPKLLYFEGFLITLPDLEVAICNVNAQNEQIMMRFSKEHFLVKILTRHDFSRLFSFSTVLTVSVLSTTVSPDRSTQWTAQS